MDRLHAGLRIDAHQLLFGAFGDVGAEARPVLNVDHNCWSLAGDCRHLRLADPGPHQQLR